MWHIPQSPPTAVPAPFNKGAFGAGPGPSSTQAPLVKGGRAAGCNPVAGGFRLSVGRDDPGAPFSDNIRSQAAGGFPGRPFFARKKIHNNFS